MVILMVIVFLQSSGYKISALEIERELLSHHQVFEAAVVGVPDVQFGEVIVAVLAFNKDQESADLIAKINPKFQFDILKDTSKEIKEKMDLFLTTRLAKYKSPRVYHLVASIPRNHLGKVNKKTLLKDLNIKV